MLQALMRVYGHLPIQIQVLARRWLVLPGKRLLSRGVIAQEGFVVAKRLDQSIAFKLFREKCYEPHLSALLRQHLKPGDTFLDIGANIGYFSLLAAACVGTHGQVYSFEPNPRTFQEFLHNIQLNQFGQIKPNNLALADKPATLQLWIGPDVDSGLASLRRTSHLLSETITCPCITLDQYITEQKLGIIHALKMDIEGAEWLALQGAQQLLRSPNRPQLIALESVRSHMASFNVTPHMVSTFLVEHDYRLHQLVERPNHAFELQPIDTQSLTADGTLIAIAS